MSAASRADELAERAALETRLAAQIARFGWERFVAAPLVTPTRAFFPRVGDVQSDALALCLDLARRLAAHADLDPDEVRVEGESEDAEGERYACAGGETWTLDSASGIVLAVADDARPEADRLTGVIAHEIAHAFRRQRGVEAGSEGGVYRAAGGLRIANELTSVREEQDTELTALYLGFGVLALNRALRIHKTNHLQGNTVRSEVRVETHGELSPALIAYAFALQLVARDAPDDERRRLCDQLETDQARAVTGAVTELREQSLPEIWTRLGLPPKTEWPEPFALPEVNEPPSSHLAKRAPVLAKNVFRVKDDRGAAGMVVGSVVGGLGAFGLESLALINGLSVLIALGTVGVLGYFVGRRFERPYCSDPSCAAQLPPGADVCPRCHGAIRGTIDHPSERLAAEDALEAPHQPKELP